MKFNVIIMGALWALFSCQPKQPTTATAEPTKHEESHDHDTEVELNQSEYDLIQIQVDSLRKRQIGASLQVNGKLDVPPQQYVSVSLPLGGMLTQLRVLEGTSVTKGQIIAQVEHPDFITLQQDYLDTKEQVQLLQLEQTRQQTLFDEDVSSKKTYERTTTDFNRMKIRLEALTQRLHVLNIPLQQLNQGTIMRTIPITAPISGFVTHINANTGKYVNSNEAILDIVDTRNMHAELTVFEKDVPKLKIGDRVRFRLTSDNQERYARIQLIGRFIEDDRTIRVHCDLEENDRFLIPGTYLKATVESEQKLVESLPESAIVQEEDAFFVFMLEGTHGNHYHFKKIRVQVLTRDNGFAQVVVPSHEKVQNKFFVTKGASDLQAKMNVGDEAGHSH